MRIALVCDEYPPQPHGGIGTFTKTYARGLADSGHDVVVIGGADEDEDRADGPVRFVGVRRTTVRGLAWLRSRAALRRRFLSLHRARRFDVVEAPEYEGLVAFGMGDVPVVLRIHGAATWYETLGARPPRPPVRWCERSTLRHFRAWISPSRHAVERTTAVLGTAPRISVVVPHPVPDRPEGGDDGPPRGLPGGPVVLFAGSLWEFRGVLHAARAARVFLPRVADASMVFVGEDCPVRGAPASTAVRAEVGPELAGRVLFPGRVSPAEVCRWMRAARVFLYPSADEAFGLVHLEAMREGLPVVASARGPGAEIVEDGVTGLAAGPDDAEALADHVVTLLRDDVLAKRLADAAKRRLDERFSVAACVRDSVAFYERALRGRSSAHC